VTAFDYADLWLHEGFAEYSEALFAEAHFGKKYYYRKLRNSFYSVKNKRPIVKPYDLRYNNLVHHNDQDIYGKGAMLLHTLRAQVNNDTLFFKILKIYQQRFAKGHMTTDRFIAFFNEETKRDFSPLFDIYLKKISPTILEFRLDKSNTDTTTVLYRWAKETPVNFVLKIPFWSNDKVQFVFPTKTIQTIKFPANNKHGFDAIDPAYIVVKENKDL
jgi:aminopeptidase N